MILDVLVYLAVFALCAITAAAFQEIICRTRVKSFAIESKPIGLVLYCMAGCLFLLPVIAMYGLRYGIGTDYFAYERIFNTFHITGLKDYLTYHSQDLDIFYVEPAYYVLNRIFPNYRSLLWGMGIIYFSMFLLAVKDYYKRIAIPFAVFIFLSTQFIFALNGTRFAVAICFLLLGYHSLAYGRTWKFIALVFVGALFHKSVLFCLVFVFIKKFKDRQVNGVRDVCLFAMIILFPAFGKYLFLIAGKLSVFERYFTTIRYSANGSMGEGWKWLLHIAPVFLPLILFCRKEIFKQEDTRLYFRICIMEVPFRMLGLLNTWYTRSARFAQIAQVLFIPLVLARVTDRKKKTILYVYYIVWYIFYFAYYAMVNDAGDSLPYVWIFSQSLLG